MASRGEIHDRIAATYWIMPSEKLHNIRDPQLDANLL